MDVAMVNGFDCTKFTGSCLKLLFVPQSWDDAAAVCESLNSRLVMVDDITENNILQKLLTDNGMSAVWLGVSDVDHEGFMVDIDGEELGYQNFYYSQPDDGSKCVTHDCVIMSGSLGYQWDDILCSSLQYACCEIIV
ncbi:CD209 antigen-like protein C [Mizuhopecten yessoensis]|uniref:CD209 antigen-like protein C n=1 Tax=Mizuhopecten yessoensis TaxID=6573 RepID=UPI000B45E1BD|nr:CD209 antigen-like protein C [Mizuhopecten yessoensis]